MKVGVSSIAWQPEDDPLVARLLRRHQIDTVDLAPGKYFLDVATTTPAEVHAVRETWAAHGLSILGLQAVMFGTVGLNLFGPPATQEAMLGHLSHTCRIAEGLGATRLVFGAPKNRDRSGLSDDDACLIATGFFRQLGDIAQTHGVTVCLEPCPRTYGANFMTTAEETAAVVTAVGHASIAMQFDTGAITTNAEDAEAVLSAFGPLVGHAHASEPELMPLGEGPTDHREAASALNKHWPGRTIVIEMLPAGHGRDLEAIERAIEVAVTHYGG